MKVEQRSCATLKVRRAVDLTWRLAPFRDGASSLSLPQPPHLQPHISTLTATVSYLAIGKTLQRLGGDDMLVPCFETDKRGH